jgi:hypothetical protein
MRIFCLVFIAILSCINSFSQLTTAADGGNKKARVGERIGITDIMIEYNRPGVKGREGKIWGQLVHTGFADQGFGTSKAAPWRAGANENTTIRFSTDVKIEGKPLPAGTYALFVAYDPHESTVIFSKNSTSWGSYFYNESEDALRVKVRPQQTPTSQEWLEFRFTNQTDSTAVIELAWEKQKIPFTVYVDVVKEQLASFRRELKNSQGFTWNAWAQAANYAIDHNTNLDEALAWSDYSINAPFIGNRNFQTLSTRARLLQKLNREKEADSLMKQALPLGSPMELHQYARQLLNQKKSKEAFDVFKFNYDKNPNTFTTNMGMARGYMATNNNKKALEFAKKALPQAPDRLNKESVEGLIKELEGTK